MFGMATLALPSAFAAPYPYTADESISSDRAYNDGFWVGPNSTVTVDVFGTAVLTSLDSVSLGTTPTGNGTLRLNGPGVALQVNASSSLRVGDEGIGALYLVNGSSASVSGDLHVGAQAGSTGYVQVIDSSQLTAGSIEVGRFGNGILNIGNGGTVTANTGVFVGGNGGTGKLTITGNGVLNGDTTLNANGTLEGRGSVGGVTVNAGGMVHVTNGTLTVNGDYTQSAGMLRVDAADGGASGYGKLNVTGTASFAANAALDVNVATVNTLAVGNVLTGVVTAGGGLTSSGFNVTDNSALFDFLAVTNANSVNLQIVSSSTAGVANAVAEHGYWSAQGAAHVLDGQLNNGATGDMSTVINALGQLPNNRAVARAAAQTLPVISGNQAVQGVLETFQRLVRERNAGATGLPAGDVFLNKNAWGKVFGSRADQDDRSGAAGFKADTWGLALGADADVGPGARFGVAYAYAKTSVDGNTSLSGSAQSAKIDSHAVSAYGSKDIGGNRTFSFQGDLGVNGSKSTRQINFGGLNRSASADYNTYSAHVGAALAQAFELSEKTTLTPALRADYTWLKSDSYQESGAGALKLDVKGNRMDAFVVGADTYLQHRVSPSSRIDAYVGFGYDMINDQGNIVSAYAGAPGQSFVTTGIDHSPWLLRGGVGYGMVAANGTDITLRYDAEGRSDYLNHTASVRAKWAF